MQELCSKTAAETLIREIGPRSSTIVIEQPAKRPPPPPDRARKSEPRVARHSRRDQVSSQISAGNSNRLYCVLRSASNDLKVTSTDRSFGLVSRD
jgi:hypothetical protein